MTDHTNEPPEPVTPGPEPDNVPQPDENEVELPPRENRPPVLTYRPRAEPRPVCMRPCTDFAFLIPVLPPCPGQRGCFSAGLEIAGLTAATWPCF